MAKALPKKACLNDGVKFVPARATAKFCSDKCRKAYARKNNIDESTGEMPMTVEVNLDLNKSISDAKGYDREANLAAFKKMGMVEVDFITTGIPDLDEFQQIPRGRVTQIQGPYAVGKTTLALNMIRGLADKKVFYIDSEASLNPWLLVELGLNAKNFTLYNESAFIEDIYDEIIKAAKSGKYEMIILDSLAACTSKTEAEGEASARNIGQKALTVNKLMRIVPMELKNNNTALVIINQEREMIGTYVPTKYTPGGMGPLYAASLILALKTIPSWRFPKGAKDDEFKGHEIEVTVKKSKVSQPHRKTKVKLYYVNPELNKEGIVPDDLVPGAF